MTIEYEVSPNVDGRYTSSELDPDSVRVFHEAADGALESDRARPQDKIAEVADTALSATVLDETEPTDVAAGRVEGTGLRDLLMGAEVVDEERRGDTAAQSVNASGGNNEPSRHPAGTPVPTGAVSGGDGDPALSQGGMAPPAGGSNRPPGGPDDRNDQPSGDDGDGGDDKRDAHTSRPMPRPVQRYSADPAIDEAVRRFLDARGGHLRHPGDEYMLNELSSGCWRKKPETTYYDGPSVPAVWSGVYERPATVVVDDREEWEIREARENAEDDADSEEKRQAYEEARDRLAAAGTVDVSAIQTLADVTQHLGGVAADVRTLIRAGGIGDPDVRYDLGGYDAEGYQPSVAAQSPDAGAATIVLNSDDIPSHQIVHVHTAGGQELAVHFSTAGTTSVYRYDLDPSGRRVETDDGPGFVQAMGLLGGDEVTPWLHDPSWADGHQFTQSGDIVGLQAYATAVSTLAGELAAQVPDFAEAINPLVPTGAEVVHAARNEVLDIAGLSPLLLESSMPPAIMDALEFILEYPPSYILNRVDGALLAHAFQMYTADVMRHNAGRESRDHNTVAAPRTLTMRHVIPGVEEYIDIQFCTSATSSPSIRVMVMRPSAGWGNPQGVHEFGYALDQDGTVTRTHHQPEGHGEPVKFFDVDEPRVSALEFLGLLRLSANARVIRTNP